MAASHQSCAGCCCLPRQGNLYAAALFDGRLTCCQAKLYLVACNVKILRLTCLEVDA